MSDFTEYTATQFLDWLTQGQINQPPSNIYVGLINPDGIEISENFDQNRVKTNTAGDWIKLGQTEVTNQTQILWQGPTTTVFDTVQSVALFDNDVNAGGNMLVKVEVDNAPLDIFPNGPTDVRIPAGELTFDILDVTE